MKSLTMRARAAAVCDPLPRAVLGSQTQRQDKLRSVAAMSAGDLDWQLIWEIYCGVTYEASLYCLILDAVRATVNWTRWKSFSDQYVNEQEEKVNSGHARMNKMEELR